MAKNPLNLNTLFRLEEKAFRDTVRREIEKFDLELLSERICRLRFAERWNSLTEPIQQRYKGADIEAFLGCTADTKVLAHARTLGLHPAIVTSYKDKRWRNGRSLVVQAKDYIRLLLNYDYYVKLMIKNSISKGFPRQPEFDYYEHLSGNNDGGK